MKQIKPFLSYQGQIERLRAHGCQIEEPLFAQTVLSQVNYYRFSAYFLPFKQRDDSYKPGTSFNSVYRIYEADRKLRSVLFSAVARIEVFLRAQFAHYHAEQYGPLGYLEGVNFRSKGHDHARFMQKINDEIRNNAKVPFVQHHIQHYNGQFPVWVIMELFTFGMLSRFYADLRTQDQKKLAKTLFELNPKTLSSWLHCCTDLRNNCAHHDRLYYRVFPSFPAGLAELEVKDRQRIFGMMLVLKALYPDKAGWNKEVFEPVQSLLIEYQSGVNLRHIGFPQNWQETLRENKNRNFTRCFEDIEILFTDDNFHSFIEVKYQNKIIYKAIVGRPPLFFLPESFKTLSTDDKEKYIDHFHAQFLDFCEVLKNDETRIAVGFTGVLRNIEEELQKTVEKQNLSNIKLPAYIQHMIDKGLLYSDGSRVVNSLDDVACHLTLDEKIAITERFLFENFLKVDGSRYSKSACKNAVNFANIPK